MARGHARASWAETAEILAAIVNHAGFGVQQRVTSDQYNPFVMADPSPPFQKVTAAEFGRMTGLSNGKR